MEEHLREPEAYDFRRYDRLWQRVAPGLEPYPAAGGERDLAPAAGGTEVPVSTPTPPTSAPAPADMTPVAPAVQDRAVSQLPGAAENPCCMGSAASEMLDVLTGFAEEELEAERQLLALSRQAPVWARQRLRELAAGSGEQARRFLAVHYLITGTCYRPVVAGSPPAQGNWCQRLRERYHAAACTALNYARAAEGTTDPCLTRLLEELSRAEYRQADALMALLERSLRL